MFKGYIIKLGLFIILTIVISACSKSENLGDLAATSNLVSNNYVEVKNNEAKKQAEVEVKEEKAQKIIEKDNTQDEVTEAPKKRGFFAWLFSKKSTSTSVEENINENTSQPDNNIKESQAKIVDKFDDETSSVNEVPTEQPIEKRKGVFSRSWSVVLGIRNIDSPLIKAELYKEDSLIMQDNLGVVVLRIPKTEELDAIKDESNNKFLETKKTVKEKVTSKEELYSGFNILNFIEEPSLTSNNTRDIEDEYLDYIVSLKYEGIISNYKNLHPHFILTNTHKTLINQLLQIDYNSSKILYVFYRNINTATDNTSVKNQLYLTSYLNVIRAYIYSKNLKNVFMQEVQIKDLPVNEVLLVIKPISFEEYNKLPKQINVYNSPKISSKAWLEKINLLERKAKEKRKKLYEQSEVK